MTAPKVLDYHYLQDLKIPIYRQCACACVHQVVDVHSDDGHLLFVTHSVYAYVRRTHLKLGLCEPCTQQLSPEPSSLFESVEALAGI